MENIKNRDFRETEIGNVKSQSNQLKKWAFTLNNYTLENLKSIETCFLQFGWKSLIQSEKGLLCHTPHIHGGIWLKKPMRWSEFGLTNRISWEKMNNEAAWIAYCQKTGEDGFDGIYRWTFGFPKPIKIIDILRPFQAEAETLLTTHCEDFSNRRLFCLYEELGNFGKSVFCKYMVVKHKAIVIQGGKLADIMNIIFNSDMDYQYPVIIDIPRCNKNYVSYSAIECILNGMITNTKYETGTKIFNPPQIMVLSNFPPETNETVSTDRWQIRNLREGELPLDNDNI